MLLLLLLLVGWSVQISFTFFKILLKLIFLWLGAHCHFEQGLYGMVRVKFPLYELAFCITKSSTQRKARRIPGRQPAPACVFVISPVCQSVRLFRRWANVLRCVVTAIVLIQLIFLQRKCLFVCQYVRLGIHWGGRGVGYCSKENGTMVLFVTAIVCVIHVLVCAFDSLYSKKKKYISS